MQVTVLYSGMQGMYSTVQSKYVNLRKLCQVYNQPQKLLTPAMMLSTTIHHVASIRRPLVHANASHFIYRCSSEVARQQVEPSIVNNTPPPTYVGAHESSAAGLPQLQVILRNSSDNGSRQSRNLRRGTVRC